MVWTGRVLSGLFVLFMLAASIAPKFLMADMVAEQSMTPLGWPAKYLMLIGLTGPLVAGEVLKVVERILDHTGDRSVRTGGGKQQAVGTGKHTG